MSRKPMNETMDERRRRRIIRGGSLLRCQAMTIELQTRKSTAGYTNRQLSAIAFYERLAFTNNMATDERADLAEFYLRHCPDGPNLKYAKLWARPEKRGLVLTPRKLSGTTGRSGG